MKQKLLSLFLLLLASNFLFCQREYFVQVSPSTCTYNIIDSIPTVKWVALGQSTFDKINGRYIFRGQDTSSNYNLYSIDATNANVVFKPPFPSGHQFGNIRFDNSSGILYGLHWVGASTNVDFVSINPSNFNYTTISTINNLTGQNNDATVDEINHRLIFSADDSSGNHCLFSIGATGNIVSKPQFPSGTNFKGFAFDNSSGILYGLRWSSSLTVFTSINPANFNYTIIDTIPYDLSGGISMGYPTFDETNKRYTFSGMDISNQSHLYTVDATNGQVISNPPFPTFIPPHNLIETKYDNSTGNLYALHWGHDTELTAVGDGQQLNVEITLYPNPSTGIFTIQTKTSEVRGIEIFNVMGEQVGNRQYAVSNNSQINIDISKEPEGVYFLRVQTAAGIISKKILLVK